MRGRKGKKEQQRGRGRIHGVEDKMRERKKRGKQGEAREAM